jgi:hypothetical protein
MGLEMLATGYAANFQQAINKGAEFKLENKIDYWYEHWCNEVSEAS